MAQETFKADIMNFNINHLSSAKFHKNWSGAKYKDQIFENSTYSEHWQNIKGSNIIMVMFFIDKIRYSLKNYVSDIFYATVSMYTGEIFSGKSLHSKMVRLRVS